MTPTPSTPELLPETNPEKWTDAQVMASLKSDGPLNRARAKFSHWSAMVEQSAMQRKPLPPIQARKMEFQAAQEIVAAFNADLPRPSVEGGCREAFEHWYSQGDKKCRSIDRSGDGYILMQAYQAWTVWKAVWELLHGK